MTGSGFGWDRRRRHWDDSQISGELFLTECTGSSRDQKPKKTRFEEENGFVIGHMELRKHLKNLSVNIKWEVGSKFLFRGKAQKCYKYMPHVRWVVAGQWVWRKLFWESRKQKRQVTELLRSWLKEEQPPRSEIKPRESYTQKLRRGHVSKRRKQLITSLIKTHLLTVFLGGWGIGMPTI